MSHDVDAFLERQARRSTPAATLKWLAENAEVRQWFDGEKRKLSTRYQYANGMRKFFTKLGMTPHDFIRSLQSTDNGSRRETKIAAKTCIAKHWLEKPATANLIISGLEAFTGFHEVEPRFELEYYQAKRKNIKKRHTWEDATAVIEECPPPYRQAFEFIRWCGLDEHTFCLINSNAPAVRELNDGDLHASLKKQMGNDRSYVRINLPPRKRSIDTYFVLAPKIYVPAFPLLSIGFEGEKVKRGNTLITSNRLGIIWRGAARRAGLYHPGFGPHNLRSVFRSHLADLGIPEAAEWMLGRGGDVYGYDRSGFDETFVIEGPKKPDGTRKGGLNLLWSSGPTVDRQTVAAELRSRDKELAEQGKAIAALEIRYQELLASTQQKLADWTKVEEYGKEILRVASKREVQKLLAAHSKTRKRPIAPVISAKKRRA